MRRGFRDLCETSTFTIPDLAVSEIDKTGRAVVKFQGLDILTIIDLVRNPFSKTPNTVPPPHAPRFDREPVGGLETFANPSVYRSFTFTRTTLLTFGISHVMCQISLTDTDKFARS